MLSTSGSYSQSAARVWRFTPTVNIWLIPSSLPSAMSRMYGGREKPTWIQLLELSAAGALELETAANIVVLVVEDGPGHEFKRKKKRS